MLRACGLKDEDFAKPLIGVANTWIEIGPCNFHLRELAVHVKDGIRAAGGTPMEFNTVSISDGITMGTEGMKASLVSREGPGAPQHSRSGALWRIDRTGSVSGSLGHDSGCLRGGRCAQRRTHER